VGKHFATAQTKKIEARLPTSTKGGQSPDMRILRLLRPMFPEHYITSQQHKNPAAKLMARCQETISSQDGISPAEGNRLFVYHTDANKGYYKRADDVFNPTTS